MRRCSLPVEFRIPTLIAMRLRCAGSRSATGGFVPKSRRVGPRSVDAHCSSARASTPWPISPIFARGAAWLPADMLVGSVSEARYRNLLTAARDGQMTMLRIWGGGIYEQDAFYNLCDELGLLVWQDFAFACMDYPDDDMGLRTEVEQEAAHQVRRVAQPRLYGAVVWQ
jgi:hypothetical protein